MLPPRPQTPVLVVRRQGQIGRRRRRRRRRSPIFPGYETVDTDHARPASHLTQVRCPTQRTYLPTLFTCYLSYLASRAYKWSTDVRLSYTSAYPHQILSPFPLYSRVLPHASLVSPLSRCAAPLFLFFSTDVSRGSQSGPCFCLVPCPCGGHLALRLAFTMHKFGASTLPVSTARRAGGNQACAFRVRPRSPCIARILDDLPNTSRVHRYCIKRCIRLSFIFDLPGFARIPRTSRRANGIERNVVCERKGKGFHPFLTWTRPKESLTTIIIITTTTTTTTTPNMNTSACDNLKAALALPLLGPVHKHKQAQARSLAVQMRELGL